MKRTTHLDFFHTVAILFKKGIIWIKNFGFWQIEKNQDEF